MATLRLVNSFRPCYWSSRCHGEWKGTCQFGLRLGHSGDGPRDGDGQGCGTRGCGGEGVGPPPYPTAGAKSSPSKPKTRVLAPTPALLLLPVPPSRLWPLRSPQRRGQNLKGELADPQIKG